MSKLKVRIGRGDVSTSFSIKCTITCTRRRAFSEIISLLFSFAELHGAHRLVQVHFHSTTVLILYCSIWDVFAKGPTAITTTTGNTQPHLLRGCVHFHDQVSYSPWAESNDVLQSRTNQDTELLIGRNVQRPHLYEEPQELKPETPTIQYKMCKKL